MVEPQTITINTDLRPDRSKLNPNFDGYKLSLDPISKIRCTLLNPPDRATTSENQYSFLHAQLFTLHNHLIRDPWSSYTVYYIDSNWSIQLIKYDTNTGRFIENIQTVFEIPNDRNCKHIRGDYNFNLIFISEKYCLLSDGTNGMVYLLDTGDRYKYSKWNIVYSTSEILPNIATDTITTTDHDLEENKRFILQDGRFDIINGNFCVNFVLLKISQNSTGGFECILNWMCIEQNKINKLWETINLVRQYKGKCLPDYCSLEQKAEGILLASDRSFVCTLNDFELEQARLLEIEKNKKIQDEIKLNNDKILFTWNQTDDEVNIIFAIDTEADKKDFKIIAESQRIHISHKTKNLLDADIYERIDAGLTTWQLENNELIVNLIKHSNIIWTSLLKNEHVAATDETNNIRQTRDLGNMPSSNLQSEMEDCDFDCIDLDQEFYFERFLAKTNIPTHKNCLGKNKPLFNVNLFAGRPSAIVIRNDVDACIWHPSVVPAPTQQQQLSSIDNKWSLQHLGTLNAFGYIQASKQQKKYMNCSPDLNYAVICEPQRHLFIYMSKNKGSETLKNRKTSSFSSDRISIGQQRLFTMDAGTEVLGMIVENDALFLLTEKELIAIQIHV